MPAPLAIALPAAAAGLAYINAKTSLWYDVLMLRAMLPTVTTMFYREHRGRLNLFYRLEDLAKSKASANRTFLLFEDKSYTYAETYERTLRYGAWWKEKMGVKKGDIIAIDFMNSDTFIFLWLGLWAVGAKPAFINHSLRGQALIHCVKAAGSKLMLVDPQVAEAVGDDVRAALNHARIAIFTPELEAEALAADPVRYPDDVRQEERIQAMAILIYTSGTTGLPKAAIVSWAKILVAGGFSARWLGTRTTDVYYTCMPLYHSSATIMCFANVLEAGATLALGKRFSTKTFWTDVRKHRANLIQYVGETCRYLLAAPPQLDPVTHENLDRKHNVRAALGNGLRPDVWNRFKDRFGIEAIAEFYGATEGSLATFNLSKNDFTMGAVGRSGLLYGWIMGLNVALVALDWDTELPSRDPRTGLCRRARPDEPGEFIFRLPDGDITKRFQGYYGDKRATAAKVWRDVFRKGDTWFRTGDVMRWDAEGRLYFHDRIGDTFRWKSENVSTTEVAAVLGRHPAVHEANVYGIRVPHHDGRAGCVALVLTAGGNVGGPTPSSSSSSSSSSSLSPGPTPSREVLASLAQHAAAGLPRYALPLFLRIVRDPSAHTTGTNKQQKHVLREQGVAPDKVGGDEIFWLRNGTYERFGPREWEELSGGRVKL